MTLRAGHAAHTGQAALLVGGGVAVAALAHVATVAREAADGAARAAQSIVVVRGGSPLTRPAGAAPLAAAAATSATFTPSAADFPNPERGFFRWADSDLDAVTGEDARAAYAEGYRLLFVRIRLDGYRDRALPAAYLAALQRGLDAMKGTGVKLIVRVVYNYPDNETDYGNAKDAPLARVRAHIDQLRPLLGANDDAIAYVQAGFVGAWGEWHTSSNGLTEPGARTAIQQALLATVSRRRAVQFRYPAHLQGWAPVLPSLDAALAGSFRLGFHNDCFLASATDVGTYDDDPTVRAQQRAYASRLTDLAPFGGETCDPADEEAPVARTTCSAIRREGALYHLTYLNALYFRDIFHERWIRDGCIATVRRKMGYRFELTDVSHPAGVRRGAAFPLALGVKNTGWARLYQRRPLEVLLVGTAAQRIYRLTAAEIDPRRWSPAATATRLRATATIPASIAPGTYEVMLALPDPSALLHPQRYAIRFANADVGRQRWDAARGAFATGTVLRID